MSSIRALTLKLQMQAIDVLYAYKEVEYTIRFLKVMRENSQREFKRIYDSANKLGQDLHGPASYQQKTSSQKQYSGNQC